MKTKKLELIIALALMVATFAMYWQVRQFDFIALDDDVYVTANRHVQSGLNAAGLRWAFSTTDAEFWHPLTWLSLMLDYQIFGLKAGGYHLTNVVLHILSTLLLFWLMNRMTKSLWKSAFVAAFFALHPLRLESVVWVAKRKDVLSVFFWMLTLCLYVYYAEKPILKRYLLVVVSFMCGLMSKPVVVTLPIIMILMDWWPLGRMTSNQGMFPSANRAWVGGQRLWSGHPIGKIILWQIKEKLPLLILSMVISVVTVHAQIQPWATPLPLSQRLMQASVVFVSYFKMIGWPWNLAVLYPLPDVIPPWQVAGAVLLIVIVSAAVMAAARRFPFLCVGWFWYAVTILPVIGISAVGPYFPHLIKDHYTYLPSVGIGIMLAWGAPLLFPREPLRRKILLPAGLAVVAMLAVLTWQQCRYWQNSEALFAHAVDVKKNNYLAYNALGNAFMKQGRIEDALICYDRAIRIKPSFPFSYQNRALAHIRAGNHQKALDDFNEAIRLKPRYYIAYMNRGTLYGALGQYDSAVADLTTAIELKPDLVDAYYNRGYFYAKRGWDQQAEDDFRRVLSLNPHFLDE